MLILRRGRDPRAVSRGLALRLCVGALCVAGRLAGQDTSAIAPGDGRVDGLRIRPYTHRYAMYTVPTEGADSGTVTERVGTLTERVQLVRVRGDTVLVATREEIRQADTLLDSLTLDRRTLAPQRARTTWNREAPGPWYREGTDFRGTRVSHFGTVPEQTSDTAFTQPAFFEGTETLLLRALRAPVSLTTSFTAAALRSHPGSYFLLYLDSSLVYVTGIARSPIQKYSADVWVLQFGRGTYWVAKDSLMVLQWEEPPSEGEFVYRFVLEGS